MFGRWIGLLRQNVGTGRKCYFNCSSREELFKELEDNLIPREGIISPYY